jgi:putative transcriptional regulator
MSAAEAATEALLLDYAAGSVSPALDLLVETHLAMTDESRDLVGMMQMVGGALLESVEAEPVERVTAMQVLEMADLDLPADRTAMAADDVAMQDQPPSAKFGDIAPPLPLQAYRSDFADERRWQRLGAGVAAASLSASNTTERAHLLWARPGTGIATHRHIGREVVLVLKGAFWDDGVRYGPGSIAIGEDGTVHAPRIDDAEDCVCLAVTEAPVKFVGPLGWVLNRFCRF